MKIKFYDFKTKKVTVMPEEELAPGCVKASIHGMEGEYFVNAADTKTASGYNHPIFDEEEKKIMRYLVHVFHDVRPISAQEWENGFRKDLNMEKEILHWLRMAEVYQHFTAGKKLSLEAKKDYLSILLNIVNAGLDFPRSLIDLQTLSRAAMEDVVKFVREFSQEGKGTAEYFLKYMETHK